MSLDSRRLFSCFSWSRNILWSEIISWETWSWHRADSKLVNVNKSLTHQIEIPQICIEKVENWKTWSKKIISDFLAVRLWKQMWSGSRVAMVERQKLHLILVCHGRVKKNNTCIDIYQILVFIFSIVNVKMLQEKWCYIRYHVTS